MKFMDGMFTGCLPRDDKLGSQFPVFEDIERPIPRNEWEGIIAERAPLRPLVQRIKEQQYGSCASHATTQAFEIAWCMAYGVEDWIEFSPMAIYPHVSSRANSGSTIGDNMRYITQSGLVPVPGGEPFLERAGIPIYVRGENDYYGRFPSGWQDTAKHFRAAEVFDVASVEGLVTGLLMGFPAVVGRSGHAICYVDPMMDGNRLSFRYANSWSPQWGDDGFGIDQESAISRAIPSYGAFLIRTPWMNDTFLNLMRN